MCWLWLFFLEVQLEVVEVVEAEVVEMSVSGGRTTIPLAEVSTSGLIRTALDTGGRADDSTNEGAFTDDDEDEWLGGIVVDESCAARGGGKGGGKTSPKGRGGGVGLGLNGCLLSLHRLKRG